MEEIINVSNLNKSFDTNHVLKGISFQVNRGDVVAVIGSSGSGKSTLLRCLIDLEKADSGTITMEGKDLMKDGVYASQNEIRAIIMKMGMVFHHFNLFPHLTVRQNLELAPKVVKKEKGEAMDERCEKHLAQVGLLEKQWMSAVRSTWPRSACWKRSTPCRPPFLVVKNSVWPLLGRL